MLQQELAVEKIGSSLKNDPQVKAIFVKGSMGRNEHDEHSDVDLYCLIDQENEEEFLAKRVEHLEAYRSIIFQDDIFIIAPQLIVVFDNLLHLDLFTVTKESFTEKDYFKVLYDPHHLLDQFQETQSLRLSEQEFKDDVMDIAWFLFQYKKANERGNDIWAVRMLTNVMDHLARALLYRYSPDRAQLGLKTLDRSLPVTILGQVKEVFELLTPRDHVKAASKISQLVSNEYEWMISHISESSQIEALLQKMITCHSVAEIRY